MANRLHSISPEIDAYIAAFPEPARLLLSELRATIRAAAPGADETINYGVPTFILNGNLVHFGGYDHHIGFYPGPEAIASFKDEISAFKWAKGSVQFPLTNPLPLDLVRRIVAFRLKQNLEKAAQPGAKKNQSATK